MIEFHSFDELGFGHAFFQRVRHVNGAGPDQEGLAPGTAKRRDIGGEGHHGGGDAIHRAQADGGDFDDLAEFGAAFGGARECGLDFGGIAYQTDHDIGAGLVGDHVGRTAPSQRSDVERAGSEQGVGGQWDTPDIGEGVEKFVHGGFAQFRIRGVGHLAGGADLVAKRAFAAQRQLVLGGLAVDDVARAAGCLGSLVSARAVALLADHEQQPKAAASLGEQRLDGFDHAGDDALGVAGASSPNEFVVLAGGEKRRHGIDVGGKGDHQRLAPLGEDVEAPRFHFDALDAAVV